MNSAGEPTRARIPVTFDGEDVTAIVAKAMTAARSAQVHWARTSLACRLELVRGLRRLIAEQAGRLAEASAAARHRPALESLTAEVMPLAEACRFLEREAKAILAPRRLGKRGLPLWLAGVRSEIHREPFGVVLIIGPGNYPLLLPGVQIIQALVAGNAVLLKPGVGGTTVAREWCELMAQAGFDSQLVGLLPESPAVARAALLARPDKVVFTGSAATGEKILAQLAPHLIPATMELSGCEAVIIRADADLDLAVRALTFGLKLNNGATCMSPKRVFVSAARATELEGRLAQALPRNRSVGAQTPSASQSFLRSVATERAHPLLADALAHGAHLIAGEITGDGTVITPIVLGGVSPCSQLLREDIFAPVLAVVTVVDDHEAILRANDCPFALTASIFSRDESGARALAKQIRGGMVTINDLILPAADARTPFGGRGRSGFGVTQGAEGLLELTTPKVITVTRGRFRPAFDAPFPGDEQMFRSYLRLAHGRDFTTRWRALVSLLQNLSTRKQSSPVKTK
ncbi:MAG: aldehyde dehydrogenase family protein [Verrucomicrobiota bacterium]